MAGQQCETAHLQNQQISLKSLPLTTLKNQTTRNVKQEHAFGKEDYFYQMNFRKYFKLLSGQISIGFTLSYFLCIGLESLVTVEYTAEPKLSILYLDYFLVGGRKKWSLTKKAVFFLYKLAILFSLSRYSLENVLKIVISPDTILRSSTRSKH